MIHTCINSEGGSAHLAGFYVPKELVHHQLGWKLGLKKYRGKHEQKEQGVHICRDCLFAILKIQILLSELGPALVTEGQE